MTRAWTRAWAWRAASSYDPLSLSTRMAASIHGRPAFHATGAATIDFTTTGSPNGALDGGPHQPYAAMHHGNCQKKQAPGDSRHAGIVAAVGRVRMMSTTILMIHRLTSAG